MLANRKAWDVIANYESHELVRARYQAKYGWRPSAAQARQIAAPFTQARHYYYAASTADRTVKPLLLYYGVTSLSRGLVLFLTPNAWEAQLAQSHGLSVRQWQSVLCAENPDISELQVTVAGSGTFVELLRATGNRNLLRWSASFISKKHEFGMVPADTVFSLGEMLARLPEVLDQYSRWQTPGCVMFQSAKIPDSDQLLLTIFRNASVSEDLVMEIVGREYGEVQSVAPNQIVVRTTQGSTVAGLPADRSLDDPFGIGDAILCQPYPSGAELAKGPQLFGIAYMLGMLVRYHPSSWMALVNQRINDAALPTLFGVIDCLEAVFPQIVVDFLEE